MLPNGRMAAAPAIALALSSLLALSGCGTTRQTLPARTATEQMLISAAAERAAKRLTIGLPPGTRVYINGDTFDGYDQKYALGAIRARVLESGANLVLARHEADVVVEARAGALSIDQEEMLLGLPSFDLPIPLSGPLKTPELSLFKRSTERGTAKFALTAYDSHSGALRAESGPVFGFSHRKRWVILLLLSWTTEDYLPESER